MKPTWRESGHRECLIYKDMLAWPRGLTRWQSSLINTHAQAIMAPHPKPTCHQIAPEAVLIITLPLSLMVYVKTEIVYHLFWRGRAVNSTRPGTVWCALSTRKVPRYHICAHARTHLRARRIRCLCEIFNQPSACAHVRAPLANHIGRALSLACAVQ